MSGALLTVDGLACHFRLRASRFGRGGGLVRAVDDVSFDVSPGETLGLVGESGCGKTTVARAIVRLAPVTAGRILFDGKDLATLCRRALREVRPSVQMVFQDPFASLNPRMTVFDAITEPLLAHGAVSRGDVPRAVSALMDDVGLARRFVRKYPHEFSGGQRQRIAIARALALEPRLLLADEPVSALDVSVQAQILNLLQEISAARGLAMLFISHDLSVVRHMARRIAVMYLGRFVEVGPAAAVLDQPAHPYTRALIGAIPRPGDETAGKRAPLMAPGDPPSPLAPPPGCRFHTRCPFASAACHESQPPLTFVDDAGRPAERDTAHRAACIHLGELDG